MERRESSPSEQWQKHEPHLRGVAERLVDCPSEADDLLQDTWLVAHLRPPKRDHSPRGWLVTVLRSLAASRRRDKGLRREREESVAEESARSNPTAAANSAERDAQLLRYVDGLGDKYSHLLYLRYWEERSPQEIAEELQLPLTTVHSRLKWGRAKLRRELEARIRGKGRNWSLVAWGARGRLLRFASPTGVVGAAGVVAAIGALVFLSSPREAPHGPPLSPDPVPLAQASPLTDLVEPSGRAPEAADPEPALARALIRTRLATTGAAAEGVELRVEPIDGTAAEVSRGVTDSTGALRVDLAPGSWLVRPDRGDPVEAELVAGEEHTIELLLPGGETVTGRAKRQGEVLSEAYIWLSWPDDPGSIRVVNRADPDGAFRLEGVDPRSWIGASRRPDHLSLLQHLDTPRYRETSWTEVVLNGGGVERVFRGRVVDPQGRPVEGARLQIRRAGGDAGWNGLSETESILRLEGRIDRSWQPAPKRSDARGAFELLFSTIRYAAYVTVHAEGFATFDGLIDESEATIVLAPEARASGRVLDSRGRPVRGAHVLARHLANRRPFHDHHRPGCHEDSDSPRGPAGSDRPESPAGPVVEAWSDDEGAFHLSGLAAGEVQLQVRSQLVGAHGFAESTFTADPGRVEDWLVRLSDTHSLVGRAVDSRGRPLVGWRVEAWGASTPSTGTSPLASPTPWSRARNDNEGRFGLVHATDPPYRLSLHPEGEGDRLARHVLEGARPGGAPVTLALAEHRPAGLTGTLLDPRGEPSSGRVILESATTGHRRTLRVEPGGEITFEGLPPGAYRLHAWPWSGVPSLAATVSLMPGQTLDLGPLATPLPSTVSLRFQTEGGDTMTEGTVSISSTIGLSTFRPVRETGVLELELPPETYDICFRSKGLGQADGTLIVPPGEALDVTFPVIPPKGPPRSRSRRGH